MKAEISDLEDQMSIPLERIPIDDEYASALGQAVYVFAICEWNVVWSCEKLKGGSLSRIRAKKMTAGDIAKLFSDLVRNMPRRIYEKKGLTTLAERFRNLVQLRNDIVHGKPGTDKDGNQRLCAPADILQSSDLIEAASAFAEFSIESNSWLHGFLTEYEQRSNSR